jgi:SAM-dependent methyltransferase
VAARYGLIVISELYAPPAMESPASLDMLTDRRLPLDFMRQLEALEKSYLAEDDPIRQSGFAGGPVRWRQEREPILDAVETDGDFLDIGCANGFLLECLLEWAAERGIILTPHGLDLGIRLIKLAKKRLPEYSSNFYTGNAWDWRRPRKFRYVYTLFDCVPVDFLEEYIRRILQRMVCRGGRLIVGAYGSRSQKTPPFDIEGFLKSAGFSLRGRASGGSPPFASFVWIDK